MSPSDARQLAYAKAVQARAGAMPPGGEPPLDIMDSWARCMDVGLDCHGHAPIAVVDGADLARRRERAELTRRLAQAELETLAQQIAGSNYLLAFADDDGVILDLFFDHRFSTSGADSPILPGSCWSEALCGTNGLGTALATAQPVAVTGLEHYFLHLRDLSCTASPVHDAHGAVVGVLDASSYFEARQRHTQALVRMAAAHMENRLFIHQMRSQVVLAVHPRPEFLATLSAGLLAFDEGGRLVALNASGRQLLQGQAGALGTSFEELFGESFDGVLLRSRRGAELRLRDAFGSALAATCVQRPAEAPRSVRTAAVRREVPVADTIDGLPPEVVADDPAVREAFRLVEAAVRLAAPLLIQGETGTGKELLARHAHRASGREGAFVAVNCGALPGELFEAELFGYVGGAFTGAQRSGSAGLIAGADGGTLLLDEVRELPLHLQAALLRFLDDQLVRPVGGTAARRVDVQVLAASNTDLADEVAAGRFRADLLYRLNTVCVALPPLRSRQDFATAARHVLAALDRSARLDEEAIERLANHDWPGNFRELRAVLTRALIACPGGRLRRRDVEPLLPAAKPAAPATGSALQRGADESVRREYERTDRNISQTARNLGISRTTVYRHLRTGRA
ncbi:sigma-54-dependent Fis family transcriptional regulator [Ideonella sp. YS5]|uniref:sigma-54-dependent Fis family transcriptional regulator n=1 Tax=Ideonella sp. YS5 TaxID=3453714 RepID=UPI003EEE7E34